MGPSRPSSSPGIASRVVSPANASSQTARKVSFGFHTVALLFLYMLASLPF